MADNRGVFSIYLKIGEKGGFLMNLEKLLQEIEMPKEMCHLLKEKGELLQSVFSESTLIDFFHRIQVTTDGWQEVAQMKQILGEDENNVGLLWVQLKLSAYTWNLYQEKGIRREIFIATMKFFSRTVREDKIRFQKWCYQTEEWGFRQLTLKIFRLGTLEYERVDDLELVQHFLSSPRYISIHIPGDADLHKEQRIASYKEVKSFMSTYFPDYQDVPIVCYSWLLSPSLKNLLPPESKILDFQEDFSLQFTDSENMSYRKWVFHRTDPDIEHYPEETSLQSRIKEYILQGGKIGIGAGPLKDGVL